MMTELKIKNLLGLAQRARHLVSGSFQVNEALQNEKVKMLIVTKDASERMVQEFEKISTEKNIPLLRLLTKESLGQCLGKDFRAVAAVLEEGFAKSIRRLSSEEE